MAKKIFFAQDIFKPSEPQKPTRLEQSKIEKLQHDLGAQSYLEQNLKPSKCLHIITNLFRATEQQKRELGINETKEVLLEVCYNCDSLRSITVRH